MNKQLKVLTLIAAMGFCGAANAAWVDNTYGAHVDLSTTVYDPYALYEFSDTEQTHALGQMIVSNASATFSAGDAHFGSGDVLLSAYATNQGGEGAWARAFIHDTLIFHVAGGGSADVLAQMSGSWGITGGNTPGTDALVTYTLNLDSVVFSGQANAYTTTTNTFTRGTLISGGQGGQYTDGGVWHVNDGQGYSINVLVLAAIGGLDGGSAFINDPLTFQLPSGVTFTSASGSTYVSAVPLPAAAWLFGSGLLGLVGVARRKKTA